MTFEQMKRIVDVVAAVLLLAGIWPGFAVVAAMIKLTSRGPVFFIQRRLGRGGHPIHVIKFRTMQVGTRPRVGSETQADDPRITRVGGWLRRSGIDELPQLLNVLGGSMSLVGPRPLLKWENDLCGPLREMRLSVKPGMTGLAQVMGRNSIPFDERLSWDIEYVKKAGPRMDAAICWRTIPVALLGRHAYGDARFASSAGPEAKIG